MTVRIISKTVTFRKPFVLGGLDETLPAGTYTVETDEELLDTVWSTAYRRVRTLIHLPANPGNPRFTRTVIINPNELDAALTRDAAPAE